MTAQKSRTSNIHHSYFAQSPCCAANGHQNLDQGTSRLHGDTVTIFLPVVIDKFAVHVNRELGCLSQQHPGCLEMQLKQVRIHYTVFSMQRVRCPGISHPRPMFPPSTFTNSAIYIVHTMYTPFPPQWHWVHRPPPLPPPPNLAISKP